MSRVFGWYLFRGSAHSLGDDRLHGAEPTKELRAGEKVAGDSAEEALFLPVRPRPFDFVQRRPVIPGGIVRRRFDYNKHHRDSAVREAYTDPQSVVLLLVLSTVEADLEWERSESLWGISRIGGAVVGHFVFAYGSLIDHHSRVYGHITILSNPVPIRVYGYRQGWLSPYGYDETTYLGVIADAKASAIGILLHLSEENLKIIDKREKADEEPGKRVYERVEVDPAAMDLLLPGEQVERPAWLYRVVKPGRPSEQCPIRQSYVDVVLRGCLSFGEDFAREWIGSCAHWNGPWEDDRKTPKFQRRGLEIGHEEEEKIDAALSDLQVLRFRRLG